MGYFQEQTRLREATERQQLEDAVAGLEGAVTGTCHFSAAEGSDKDRLLSAIDEVLRWFRIRPAQKPERALEPEALMQYLMRPCGIMQRPLKLEGDWYHDARGPMIAVTTGGVTLALLPDHRGHYTFTSPDTGRRTRVGPASAGQFQPDAFLFYRSLPMRKLDRKDLLLFVRSCVTAYDTGMTVLLALLAVLAGGAAPLLTLILMRQAQAGTGLSYILPFFLLLVGAALFSGIFSVLKGFLLSRIARNISLPIQAAFMLRILSLPVSALKRHDAGSISSRIIQLDPFFRGALASGTALILTALLSLIYLIPVLVVTPFLVLPAVVILIVLTVFHILTACLQAAVAQEQLTCSNAEAGLSYSILKGIQKILVTGSQRRMFRLWAGYHRKTVESQHSIPLLLKIRRPLARFLTLLGTVLIYSLCLWHRAEPAAVFAFFTAWGLLLSAFQTALDQLMGIARTLPAIRQLKPLMDAVPELSGQRELTEPLHGEVELDNVSFRYEADGPLVLNGISLKIKKGEYVGIVGTTGCGKSTLLRLLLGFETPVSGEISYDGRPLRSLDLQSLRRQIGTVMQDDTVFQGTIFSNLTINAPGLSEEDAWHIAEMAGVADVIRDLPLGLKTPLTDGGKGISGGERQRIMIARAIAPRPRLVILDEATSALDNVSQKIVSDSLDCLDCTRIVVAHRLSTIAGCDRILVLDAGRIVEEGTYESLMDRQGLFYDLVRRQQI